MSDEQTFTGREILVVGAKPYYVEQLKQQWLEEKFTRSASAGTKRKYEEIFGSFRHWLWKYDLDLDSDQVRVLQDEHGEREVKEMDLIAFAAQEWAGVRAENALREGTVAPSTYNLRLAVISSFYEYAIKMGALQINPIDKVARARVQGYAHAQALLADEIKEAMSRIDRKTLDGKRDYALLSIALHTGRRLSEIAGMTWGHLKIRATRRGERVSIHFPRLKGGKVGNNDLEAETSFVLLEYLHALYGSELGQLPRDAPIWVSLSHNGTKGQALSARSLERICEKWCGTGRFHTLRSSFAVGMEEAGAKVSEIQAKLGHESLATTGRYLAQLRSAENKHGKQLEVMFGITADYDEE